MIIKKLTRKYGKGNLEKPLRFGRIAVYKGELYTYRAEYKSCEKLWTDLACWKMQNWIGYSTEEAQEMWLNEYKKFEISMEEFWDKKNRHNIPPSQEELLKELGVWFLYIEREVLDKSKKVFEPSRIGYYRRRYALNAKPYQTNRRHTMFNNTVELRNEMVKLYKQVHDGEISNNVARTKVLVAKTIIDTLKVEITAASLGKQFGAVAFNDAERGPKIRAIK